MRFIDACNECYTVKVCHDVLLKFVLVVRKQAD